MVRSAGDQDQTLRNLSPERREALMLRAAKLYYEMGSTQAEVGKTLGLNRFQISRLLQEARDTGIVRIEISARSRRLPHLEVRLQKAFGLLDAIVIGGPHDDPAMASAAAQAAANHLSSITPAPMRLAVSWGRTMALVVDHLPQGWAPGCEVVLLNGNTHLRRTNQRNTNIAERIASLADGTAVLLPVPAVMGKSATRDALLDDPLISQVLKIADEAPIACFALGAMGPGSVLCESGYITPEGIAELGAAGAVGDILGRFINDDGEIVSRELDDRTVGLSLQALRNKEMKIGIATGPTKRAVLAATMRAGYVNVPVTDEATARHLLESIHAS